MSGRDASALATRLRMLAKGEGLSEGGDRLDDEHELLEMIGVPDGRSAYELIKKTAHGLPASKYTKAMINALALGANANLNLTARRRKLGDADQLRQRIEPKGFKELAIALLKRQGATGKVSDDELRNLERSDFAPVKSAYRTEEMSVDVEVVDGRLTAIYYFGVHKFLGDERRIFTPLIQDRGEFEFSADLPWDRIGAHPVMTVPPDEIVQTDPDCMIYNCAQRFIEPADEDETYLHWTHKMPCDRLVIVLHCLGVHGPLEITGYVRPQHIVEGENSGDIKHAPVRSTGWIEFVNIPRKTTVALHWNQSPRRRALYRQPIEHDPPEPN